MQPAHNDNPDFMQTEEERLLLEKKKKRKEEKLRLLDLERQAEYETAAKWHAAGQEKIRRSIRMIALCALVPTLVSSLYFGLIAAPQFQTDMHIAIRSAQANAATGTIGSLLGGIGAPSQSVQDVRGIAEYIRSYSAVQQLVEKVDLRAILSNEKADIITRMPENASLETMHDYYLKHVSVVFNSDSGGLSVFVRAYEPQHAVTLANAILALSEETVNGYNKRAENDMLQLARAEQAHAEERVAQINAKLTEYRRSNQDIDPASRSGAILGGISGLEQEYNAAQVELRQLSASSTGDNVQLRALRRKVSALKQQIAQEQNRLTGSGNTYSQKIAEYETLLMEQELAQQAYASALVSLENAQLEAQRQKSYVVPIVKPHLPQDAEYPRRLRAIILTFVAALLAFGIGRLVLAGVRDHMMH